MKPSAIECRTRPSARCSSNGGCRWSGARRRRFRRGCARRWWRSCSGGSRARRRPVKAVVYPDSRRFLLGREGNVGVVYHKEIIELALARPMLGTIKVQRSRPRRACDIGGGEPGRAACPCTARARLFLAKTPSVDAGNSRVRGLPGAGCVYTGEQSAGSFPIHRPRWEASASANTLNTEPHVLPRSAHVALKPSSALARARPALLER